MKQILKTCPYCLGLGKVSKERAEKKITTRNRATFNATMARLNRANRLKDKTNKPTTKHK